MANVVDTGGVGKAAQGKLVGAMIGAVATSAVVFVMCSLIVGQKITVVPGGGVTLISSWHSVLAYAFIAGVGRFLLAMFVWGQDAPKRVQHAHGGAATLVPLLAALGVVWLLGMVFYFFPAMQTAVARSVGGLFAGPGGSSHAQKTVELIAMLMVAVSFVTTAMGTVFAVRRYPPLLVVLAVAFCLYYARRAALWLVAASGEAEAATASEMLFRAAVLAVILLSLAAVVWMALRSLTQTADPEPGAVEPRSRDTLLAQYWRQFPFALLAIAVALPLLITGSNQGYVLTIGMQILTYVMLGWGLNVVVGLAGLLDLGYVAFYAVGAYSYALIATTFGWSFWLCLPLAGVFAALWGIMLGFPVLRLRGDYLAIVTMAFGEIIHTVAKNWVSLTNGPNGISRVPKPSFFGLSFNINDVTNVFNVFNLGFDPLYRSVFMYYVILALALVVNAVSMRMRTLPLGRAWEALREDEIACRSLGINTVTTKLTAFAIGAMFGGFAGAFFASQQGIITPESFKFGESAMILAIVVLGGMGSQIGVALAAVVLIGAGEFFRDLAEYRMLIFGLAMMVIMVWRPRGLVGSRTPSVVLKTRKSISGSLVKEGAG